MVDSLDRLIVRYDQIKDNLIRLIDCDIEANDQAIILNDGQLTKTFNEIMSLTCLTPSQRQIRIHFLTAQIKALREDSETIAQLTDKILVDVSELLDEQKTIASENKLNVVPIKDFGGETAWYNAIRNDLATQKAAKIKSEYLEQAIKSISDAFILYDANGNLILYNEIHRDFFPHLADLYRSGAKREEVWRHHAIKMRENNPTIDVEEYVRKRKQQGHEPRSDYERQLMDGRWVLTRERFLADGGVVSIRTDITMQKLAIPDGLKLAT
jgi:PAS domain-containing protein